MADETQQQPQYGLGRIHAPDDRDRQFMLPRQAEVAPTVTYKYWTAPQPLDQGATSTCVGHGWFHYLKCSPVRNIEKIPSPYEIYDAAQLVDEWEGTDYDGTSVRAGAKVLKARGYLSGYRWAFDGATVVNHLLTTGPAVIGTSWTEGMMSTDEQGFVYPRGRLVGGHCVVVIGTNTKAKCPDGRIGFATFLNSWSRDWGSLNGRGRIVLEDLDALIRDQGEACVATEVLKPVPVA
jgi:hypothetical protein